jgi:adenine-specific DNA-methyltransferase
MIGFENHLNVLHIRGAGLPPDLARGLGHIPELHAGRFVSFRQFSGHTQVNANDLRTLRYPRHGPLLMRWGSFVQWMRFLISKQSMHYSKPRFQQ